MARSSSIVRSTAGDPSSDEVTLATRISMIAEAGRRKDAKTDL